MFANIRSTLPHKNFDIIEKTVLAGTLDPKYIRALNTGIFYPETADVADDASDADDGMPALDQASVGSVEDNDCGVDGRDKQHESTPPGRLEPRSYNRPGRSRPAPALPRDPITEQVKQHAEQVARKEAKARAAKRRQPDGEEVRARAERPEELFQHEREERDRLRAEKGFVVDEEDEENPKMYVCCLKDLQADLKGMAGVNAGSLVCKYDEEEYSIRANAHRLRMDCEKGHEMRCHHPQCVRALIYCGVHSREQPWGKMDAKNTSQQLSKDGVVMRCLKAGCDGRVIRTAIEKDRGVRRAEVWYHAKWHQDILDEEERQKKQQEEEAARARAEMEEQRKKDQKAADVEAKKQAKIAAKAAKEQARRPDLVGLDGVQVPVPPKKTQKARAPPVAPKPDMPKPNISEVERMIEQEGATAVQPRHSSDDVFAAVPQAKRKDKRKEKKDKKKKVLEVEFGERGDEAEAQEATGVDVQVERAVHRVPPPEAADTTTTSRHVEDFPDLAPGPAQASGDTASLAMLEARNFREDRDSLPITPFLLCKNLDVTLLYQSAPQRMEKKFQSFLPRVEVHRVRVFEEAACAALEVNYYDGESACKNLNGQLLGSRPVVVTHLIEFPDEELMSALSAARLSGEDGDSVIRYIVGQRRRARGQRSLPTHDEILARRAAQAAAAVAVPPPALQQEPPARKGALHSMNPVAAEFHPATKAQTPPAVPPAAPERTYEDAERWLRSTQNPNAGLAAIPQVWVNVTDLYVFPIRVESFFKEHYMNKPAFRLKYDYFPGFKETVQAGRRFTAALVFYMKDTRKFFGVMCVEPGQDFKADCRYLIPGGASMREAPSRPQLSDSSEAELQGLSVASHFVSTPAWQILHAFSPVYAL